MKKQDEIKSVNTLEIASFIKVITTCIRTVVNLAVMQKALVSYRSDLLASIDADCPEPEMVHLKKFKWVRIKKTTREKQQTCFQSVKTK